MSMKVRVVDVPEESDKMSLNPIWRANLKDANEGAWTRAQEGLVHNYWDGEE